MAAPSPQAGAEGEVLIFVYGTLADTYVLSVVTGERAWREAAVLEGYEKIASYRSFPYILPRAGGEVPGFLIGGLSRRALELIDRYEAEGRLYLRELVPVRTAAGERMAFTYVAGPELIASRVPVEVEVHDRVVAFLTERIEDTVAAEVPPASRVRELEVRARGELLGAAIADLVRDHFQHPGLPPFVVKHRLAESGLASLKWLAAEPAAAKFAPAYLRLAVKTIIFNQVEERVNRDFRGEVRVADAYYDHAVSACAALRFVADNLGPIGEMTASLGMGDYDAGLEYMDYAVAALFIADELYDRARLAPYVARIQERRAKGVVPLGCEVEFSPLGRGAVGAAPEADDRFDCFYYFDDYDLGGRLWKLGGHVDNHRVVTADRGRVRGFLEFALGRLKVLGDLSKPVTADPVLLSDLANAAVAFAEVKPHSLHISMEVEEGRTPGSPPPATHLICLLILGGDVNRDEGGALREKRLYQREIYNEYTGLDFSRLNRHRQSPEDAAAAVVMEYQFPRLFYEHSYVDLIMALKGFQLASNPPPLDLSPGSAHLARNREIEQVLLGWAEKPYALARADVDAFLATVERGLSYEIRKPEGPEPAFVARWMDRVEAKLRAYNAYIWGGGKEWLVEL